jgi:REP element-mobilizing transposase RayT
MDDGGRVETDGRRSLHGHHHPFRQPKSISSFLAGFKSAVNSRIDDFIDENDLDIPKFNRKNHFFQPNYHDRIIRNEGEFLRIAEYIRNNPRKWSDDRLNNK